MISIIFSNFAYLLRNTEYTDTENQFNSISYYDLGSNNGDSILWLFGYKRKNASYHVPYPLFHHFPTTNVNIHSFEANPLLCNAIKENILFLKKVTYNCNFYINCPIIVSNRSDVLNFKITTGTLGSSVYYSKNKTNNKIIRIKSIDIIEYMKKYINSNDFNILKFDIEGEEYYMIPRLIQTQLLKEFDIVFSEFHPFVNNPVGKSKSENIFLSFVNYMKCNMIPYFEEYNISKDLMKLYHYKINTLFYFRKFLFEKRREYISEYFYSI